MKRHVADLLVDFAGDEDLTLHEDYSGRGMYGDRTSGVVGESSAFNRALAEFIREAQYQDEDDCNAVADALRNLRQDSMGLRMIWY